MPMQQNMYHWPLHDPEFHMAMASELNDSEKLANTQHCPIDLRSDMDLRSTIPDGSTVLSYDSDGLYYSDTEDEKFEEDQPIKSPGDLARTGPIQPIVLKFEDLYKVEHVLTENATSSVYTGVRISDGLQVIIKQGPIQALMQVTKHILQAVLQVRK